jgi:GTP cyclohydrolase I
VLLRDIRSARSASTTCCRSRGAHIAYLPGEQVVGLGALPKVVEMLAARPQVQERLGEQIADTIAASLDARGCSSCSTRTTSASRCAADASRMPRPSRSPRAATRRAAARAEIMML